MSVRWGGKAGANAWSTTGPGPDQRQELARVVEVEICVQRAGSVGTILPGGEDNDLSARCEVRVRETPIGLDPPDHRSENAPARFTIEAVGL